MREVTVAFGTFRPIVRRNAMAEIGAIADITEDSFLGRKFSGRFHGRYQVNNGHAENVAKCRD
jgi:hypothetical protein